MNRFDGSLGTRHFLPSYPFFFLGRQGQRARLVRTLATAHCDPQHGTRNGGGLDTGTTMESVLGMIHKEDWDGAIHEIETLQDGQLLPGLFKQIMLARQLDLDLECPKDVIEALLRRAERDVASFQSPSNGTPLGIAIEVEERLFVIERLIKLDPKAVQKADMEYQTPLDVISRKIMMAEEFRKYSSESDRDITKADYFWECARLMLSTFCLTTEEGGDLPLLHAVVCAGSECPESLRTRVFRKFGTQLLETDNEGNLALHLAASIRPAEEEMGDDLQLLVEKAPGTVNLKNGQEKTPIQIAEESGRTWETGIDILVKTYPPTLLNLNLPEGVYPILFEKIGVFPDTLYRFLRSRPDLFINTS